MNAPIVDFQIDFYTYIYLLPYSTLEVIKSWPFENMKNLNVCSLAHCWDIFYLFLYLLSYGGRQTKINWLLEETSSYLIARFYKIIRYWFNYWRTETWVFLSIGTCVGFCMVLVKYRTRYLFWQGVPAILMWYLNWGPTRKGLMWEM